MIMISLPGQIPSAEEATARMAIVELLNCHSRALDRLDASLMKAVYWPTATVDYGGFKGKAHVFADLVMGALAGQYQLTQHRVTNTVFEFFDDDHAATETLVFAKHLSLDGGSEMVFSGRYLDRFERDGANWKFIFRRVVMDWSRRRDVVDERCVGSFAALTKGANDGQDPSWDHFALNTDAATPR
jgi:hypothetical protein